MKINKTLLVAILALGSFAASAQTNGTAVPAPAPGATSTQPTTAVGVTPQEASQAIKKAVPRSDTATVVTNPPKAAQSAPAVDEKTVVTTGANANADVKPMKSVKPVQRKARADRN